MLVVKKMKLKRVYFCRSSSFFLSFIIFLRFPPLFKLVIMFFIGNNNNIFSLGCSAVQMAYKVAAGQEVDGSNSNWSANETKCFQIVAGLCGNK